MDLGPDDVASLCQMGRFTPEAPPSPLTWRKSCAVVEEQALVYLHSCKPQILHRDFKEANILLDGGLHAYLSDTGFAKAAQRGGGGGGATVGMSTTVGGGALGYTPGYADEDVLLGKYSESSDGFAVGRTLLVVLTNRSAVKIIEGIEKAHDDDDFGEIDPARSARRARAGPRRRLPPSERSTSAVPPQEEAPPLTEVLPTRAVWWRRPAAAAAAATPPTAAAASSAAALPERRRCRCRCARCGGPPPTAPLSVQRSVMLAFDDFMQRLDAVYVAQSAAAPPEFVDRINYWRDRCGLAAGSRTSCTSSASGATRRRTTTPASGRARGRIRGGASQRSPSATLLSSRRFFSKVMSFFCCHDAFLSATCLELSRARRRRRRPRPTPAAAARRRPRPRRRARPSWSRSTVCRALSRSFVRS